MSDGAGAWDNADAVPGRNYVATRAGTYRLCDGNLMLLPPKLPLLLVRRLRLLVAPQRSYKRPKHRFGVWRENARRGLRAHALRCRAGV